METQTLDVTEPLQSTVSPIYRPSYLLKDVSPILHERTDVVLLCLHLVAVQLMALHPHETHCWKLLVEILGNGCS